MTITDAGNLIPDRNVLEKIIKGHPLSQNLWTCIKNVTIELSAGPSESISFDIMTMNAILYLFRDTASKPEYEFILYHEFSHIADKLNVEFKYSDTKWVRLKPREQGAVGTLWDCYINSRLNERKLIPVWYANFDRGNRIDYLESCGLIDSELLFEEIWNNPWQFLSFDDMIEKVSGNKGKLTPT
jgi:hypothetical protein